MKVNSFLVMEKGEWTQENLKDYEIPNPEYLNNQRLGYSNRGIEPIISLYRIKDGELYLPRNSFPKWINSPNPNIKDERSEGTKVQFNSSVKLRPDQIPAVKELVKFNDGILNAGCGKGKTVMFLDAMARVGTTTLILVHKSFLLDQWIARAIEHLNLKREEIGVCQGNINKWDWKDKKLVIGMLQSIHVYRENLSNEFRNYFGLIGADECHRMSAPTFAEVIIQFPSKRRWGLTATIERSDGLEVVFQSHIGPICYQLLGTNLDPVIYPKKTGVEIDNRKIQSSAGAYGKLNLSALVTELTNHDLRNKKILGLLIQAADSGRRIIILSDRREHAIFLKESFDLSTKNKYETRLYLGGMGKEEREEAEKNARLFFSTFQMAKEGLDIPTLDTLFLVTPNGSEITIEQSLGRISREHPNKKQPMVVDFVDENLSYCIGLYHKRLRVYRKLNLQVN